MILTWNVRGLNKTTRHKEVGSHLKKLNCACVGLLETRVKVGHAMRIKNRLGKWNSVDNYCHHDNGRIGVLWDHSRVDFKVARCYS